jgi:quercetin dioxygenase-like cupin family protein
MTTRRRGRATPRFITAQNAGIELAPWGKHWWLSRSDLTGAEQLTLVRVRMRPGTGHNFHYHPELEEIIYVLDGVAEQWVDAETRRLKAGECAFIPAGVVHAIFNSSAAPMTFLAILSPARSKGPFLIDCYDEEPWRSLRPPQQQRRRVPGKRRSR